MRESRAPRTPRRQTAASSRCHPGAVHPLPSPPHPINLGAAKAHIFYLGPYRIIAANQISPPSKQREKSGGSAISLLQTAPLDDKLGRKKREKARPFSFSLFQPNVCQTKITNAQVSDFK
jgi:hypothetical protein